MSAEWIKTAKIGDKVVCIDDQPLASGLDTGLVKGDVYTIINIVFDKGRLPNGIVCDHYAIGLQEVLHPKPKRRGGCFGAFRFRPVHPRKTDIAWAYELLRPAPADQPVKEEA